MTRNETIRHLRQEGRKLVSLAAEFGVTKQRISQICTGYRYRRIGKRFDHAAIYEDFKSGLSPHDVEHKHGCSYSLALSLWYKARKTLPNLRR